MHKNVCGSLRCLGPSTYTDTRLPSQQPRLAALNCDRGQGRCSPKQPCSREGSHLDAVTHAHVAKRNALLAGLKDIAPRGNAVHWVGHDWLLY